jgi:hypothetical protein
MTVTDNVIHFDPPTWFCMRQCKESIKWCQKQNNPIYQTEIEGEKALLRGFMDEILGRAA